MNRKVIGSAGVFVLSIAVLSSASVLAQGRGRGQGKTKEPAARSAQQRDARPVFHDRDRQVISDYFGRRSGLPPGLAKRGGDLPPGLERQLQRNGTLPPGLRKQLKPLPRDLERQLSALPRGYRRAILDRHLLVYRTNDYAIADLFRDGVR